MQLAGGRDIPRVGRTVVRSCHRVERLLRVYSPPDERARAERFVFEHHRACLRASRGILGERCLGRYISLHPADIHSRTEQGKTTDLPNLAAAIRFNFLSSAGNGFGTP